MQDVNLHEIISYNELCSEKYIDMIYCNNKKIIKIFYKKYDSDNNFDLNPNNIENKKLIIKLRNNLKSNINIY